MSLFELHRNKSIGEFVDSATVLAYIQDRNWDTNGDGSGYPRNGMEYTNTTDGIKYLYDSSISPNGAWVPMGFTGLGSGLWVDGSRSDDYVEDGTELRPYKTISDAVTYALDNHISTIVLKPHDYHEEIVLDGSVKSGDLFFVGLDKNTTIISGSGTPVDWIADISLWEDKLGFSNLTFANYSVGAADRGAVKISMNTVDPLKMTNCILYNDDLANSALELSDARGSQINDMQFAGRVLLDGCEIEISRYQISVARDVPALDIYECGSYEVLSYYGDIYNSTGVGIRVLDSDKVYLYDTSTESIVAGKAALSIEKVAVNSHVLVSDVNLDSNNLDLYLGTDTTVVIRTMDFDESISTLDGTIEYRVPTSRIKNSSGLSGDTLNDSLALLEQKTKIIYVDGSRSDSYTEQGTRNEPYKTIASAISNSSAGDTILIAPGFYTIGSALSPVANTTIKGISGSGIDRSGVGSFVYLRRTTTGSVFSVVNEEVCLKNLSINAEDGDAVEFDGCTGYVVNCSCRSATAAGLKLKTATVTSILCDLNGDTYDLDVDASSTCNLGWSRFLNSGLNAVAGSTINQLFPRSQVDSDVESLIIVAGDNTGEYVEDGSFERPYKTIAAALSGIASGSTILVYPKSGGYVENLTWPDKKLSLIGTDREKVIITCSAYQYTIYAYEVSHDITIENLTVNNTGDVSNPYGIWINGNNAVTSNVILRNLNLNNSTSKANGRTIFIVNTGGSVTIDDVKALGNAVSLINVSMDVRDLYVDNFNQDNYALQLHEVNIAKEPFNLNRIRVISNGLTAGVGIRISNGDGDVFLRDVDVEAEQDALYVLANAPIHVDNARLVSNSGKDINQTGSNTIYIGQDVSYDETNLSIAGTLHHVLADNTLPIKEYYQAAEPTLPLNSKAAVWTDSDDELSYLIWKDRNGNQQLVNLGVPVGNMLWVDGSRSGSYTADGTQEFPYQTIQAAINAASAGDVVFVLPGTYAETITLKDQVSVVGTDVYKTLIQKADAGNAVTASSAGTLSLANLYMIAANGDAFSASGSSNVNILNCAFNGSGNGATISGGSGTRMQNVYMNGGTYDLSLVSSANVSIGMATFANDTLNVDGTSTLGFIQKKNQLDSKRFNVIWVDGERSDSYVADGTPERPYKTIQDAIDAASADDTIYVLPGTYDETVTPIADISIVGVDPWNTIINRTDTADAVSITVNNVRLMNLKIDADDGDAVSVSGGATGVELFNCHLIASSEALKVAASATARALSCKFDGSASDVDVDATSTVQYSACVLANDTLTVASGGTVTQLYEKNQTKSSVGDTFYVDGNRADAYIEDGTPERPFQKIQDALDAASTAGKHTVFVKAGSYSEDLTMKNGVNLEGESRNSVIVQASTLNGVTCSRPSGVSCMISNLTLESNGTGKAYYSTGTGTETVKNVYFDAQSANAAYAIHLENITHEGLTHRFIGCEAKGGRIYIDNCDTLIMFECFNFISGSSNTGIVVNGCDAPLGFIYSVLFSDLFVAVYGSNDMMQIVDSEVRIDSSYIISVNETALDIDGSSIVTLNGVELSSGSDGDDYDIDLASGSTLNMTACKYDTSKTNIAGTIQYEDRVVQTHWYKKVVNYDDSSPVAICSVKDGDVIEAVRAKVTTTFDGDTTLNIGDGSDPNGFADTSKLDLGNTGWKLSNLDDRGDYLWDSANGHKIDHTYSGSDTIDAAITTSTGTQGVIEIYVKISHLADVT